MDGMDEEFMYLMDVMDNMDKCKCMMTSSVWHRKLS